MTPLVILLVAAPVVFWLFRRRPAPRLNGDHLEQSIPVGTISEKFNHVEPSPLGSHCTVRESESGEALTAAPRIENVHRLPPLGESRAVAVDLDKGVAPGATAEANSGQIDLAPADAQSVPSPLPSERFAETQEPAATIEDSFSGYWDLKSGTSVLAAIPEPSASDRALHVCENARVSEGEVDSQTPDFDVEPPLDTREGQTHNTAVTATVPTFSSGPTKPSHATPEQPGSLEEAAPPIEVAEETFGIDVDTPPPRYRPPSQRQIRRPLAREANPARTARSEAALEIRVRLTIDRFGFCEIGLLPERKPGLDDEITVKTGGVRLNLIAQEDWYSDLRLENIGERLREGMKLTGLLAGSRRMQWQLKGRNLFVLAGHPSASGFVSDSRLVLGRSHVVLCVDTLLENVETILQQAGCSGYRRLDESHGMPAGWIGLRDVSPTTPITLTSGSDPFYAIKPAPDIEISLSGGVRLHDWVWLAGYPPRIRLLGQVAATEKVLIDGKEAEHDVEDRFLVDGYDLPGQHFVHCEGLSCSRSYSIEEPDDAWHQWPAYCFGEANICGPLVQLSPAAARTRLFTVPMSNPLLLGAEPGHVFRCSPRSTARWIGFVPFDVVWALPAQPLISDKKTARILQFSSAPVAHLTGNTRAALTWCSAILDASRKGLRIDNASPESTAQWIQYKNAARKLWRGRR